MGRPWFLLAMLAALAGTPLRIAEAADDLARALAEVAGDSEIEVIDGGVGDDSGATIRGDVAQAPDSSGELLGPVLFLAPDPPGLGLSPESTDGPTVPRSARPPRRFAVLLRFRC